MLIPGANKKSNKIQSKEDTKNTGLDGMENIYNRNVVYQRGAKKRDRTYRSSSKTYHPGGIIQTARQTARRGKYKKQKTYVLCMYSYRQ